MTSQENAARLTSASARKVQEALDGFGMPGRVIEMTRTTRSASDAAAAVGCSVGQIVKSLVFKAASGRPVLVLTSGANRVDEARLAEALGEPVAKADAEFVRRTSGFAIGGVPPLGHCSPMIVLVDEDLLAHAAIWAAAGTPQAVFQLTPQELIGISGGRVVRVKPELSR
jgi:prolyl-tRNA editing enzyme YbaK/EbsC (Cys-tRNA(Pro) deacylase)